MPKWNPMQEKAIYTKEKNILVSASAGSGKTTVLIARLCHLIQEERVSVENILAMTFTEAAASEMKKRLAVALKEAMQKSKEETEKAYLQKQLANVSSAYISTIHGFCLNIIQNHYYAIGLDKQRANNILEESTKQQMMGACMEDTLSQYFNDPAFHELCTIFHTRADSLEALKQQILALFYLAQSKSNPIAFLNHCKNRPVVEMIADLPEYMQSAFFDALAVEIQSMLDTILEASYTYDDEDLEKANEKKHKLEQVLLMANQRDYTSLRTQLFEESTLFLPAPKDNDIAKRCKKEIEAIENKLHAILYEEKDFIAFHNANTKPIQTLVDVTCTFLSLYEKAKEKQLCMDFSDMEHFALAILQANDNRVANLYKEQFVEIMVDEFQDSNDVQDTLVSLICKENNVFRVGDIKQSIYGFRHATPDIMRDKIDHKSDLDEVIYLSNNYRSKKAIVDFNNTLFDQLMNVKGFASSFKEYDHTLTGIPAQEEHNEPICLHLLDDKSLCDKTKKESKDTLKASYIANQILTLRKEKGYAFKDFVVLVKANAKSEFLRTTFEEANIPYFINLKFGFYHTPAVQNVLSFLKALDDPSDDIAMCATLLSPFFAFSDSDLAKAKQKKEEQSYYAYFKEQIPAFTHLKQLSKTEKVSTLLMEMYQLNGFYETYASAQDKSNLDKLLEIITQKEANEYVRISAFLQVLENSENLQIGEAIPIGIQDDVVRVMSIHQSKGLQFPVVFLYSTTTNNMLDTKGLCAMDSTFGIAMQYMDSKHRFVYPTIERIALNHKITKSQLEEEMRVLYVATTRAQTQMHIVDCGKEEPLLALSQSEIYKKKGFTGWIRQCFAHTVFPMLKTIYVTERWEEEQVKDSMQESTSNMIPRYQKASTSLSTLSPSESEIFTFTPRQYNENEAKAMEKGTKLHEMVEHLPSCAWDERLLEEIAEKRQYTLDEKEKQVLLALSQNAIFQETFAGEVHHEYPFMVQKEEVISHGYMDYVSLFEDRIILVDFKSDYVMEETILLERYTKQLKAYEEALQLLYPNKQIEAYIYSFHLRSMIPVL